MRILLMISIHAPTRGATFLLYTKDFCITFQSTLPQGERRSSVSQFLTLPEFQSTLPQGERRMKKQISSWIFYFNPRSHKGSDIYGSPHGQAHINFNPRSHKGSDGNTSGNTSGNTISIHAPTRGATDAIMSTLTKLFQFQSTLPQGERRSSMHSGSTQTYFNPRSHKGSDSNISQKNLFIQ